MAAPLAALALHAAASAVGGRTEVGLRGMAEVLANLNREVGKIKYGTAEGLTAAGQYVLGESNEMVPVQYGTLLNSGYVDRPAVTPRGKSVSLGYTAEYAPVVHEMPETFSFTKPGTGPKFLSRAISENVSTILRIIAARARVR